MSKILKSILYLIGKKRSASKTGVISQPVYVLKYLLTDKNKFGLLYSHANLVSECTQFLIATIESKTMSRLLLISFCLMRDKTAWHLHQNDKKYISNLESIHPREACTEKTEPGQE